MGQTVNGIDQEVMTPGIDPKERGYPGFNPRREVKDGLTIDYDVTVTLHDGVKIYTDVYRPEGDEGPLPVMLLWSGYGKHFRWTPEQRARFTNNAPVSDYAPIEAQDPTTWCPAGYAVVVPDPRGINASEGEVSTWSPAEGDDIHDTIEWIAGQPWSNGKVGMGGASSFAIVQWFAGATRPPHLAALMPYDGMSDLYREVRLPRRHPQRQLHQVLEPANPRLPQPGRGLDEGAAGAPVLRRLLGEQGAGRRADRRADLCDPPAGATTPSTRAARSRRGCGSGPSRSGCRCMGATSGRTYTRRRARGGRSPSSTASSRVSLTRWTAGPR